MAANISRKSKKPRSVACEACKLRKVKCDRTHPACGWCARNNKACEYKERRKPGLRTGYGQQIETRLAKLEEIIAEQSRQLQQRSREQCQHLSTGSLITERAEISDPFSAGANTYPPNQSRRVLGSQQSNSGISLSPNHGMEGLSASPYRATPLVLPESPASRDQPSTQYTTSIHSYSQNSPCPEISYQSQYLYANITFQLPPYDLIHSLVNLYFQHINSWLPLLNRKTTMDALLGKAVWEEADRILLHAIIAISLRFSQDPRLTPENKQQYYVSSKNCVQLYGLEISNVRALQALTILALDLTGTMNGPRGRNLLALISKSIVQLGLAVESNSSLVAPPYPSIATLRATVLPEPKSWVEDEERRRLFWTVYLLDRYATLTTAFEFALDEKEIDRRLPCRDQLFAANKSVETPWLRSSGKSQFSTAELKALGSFSYHCQMLGILTRIHQAMKRPIDIRSVSDVEQWQTTYRTLDSELHALHFNLPDEFASLSRLIKSDDSALDINCGWIMLHAAYSFTVIRLNSSAAYPSAKSPIFTPSYSAMQRCLTEVDNIRKICHYVVGHNILDKVGPPFAFALWVAARVVLVHQSRMDDHADANPDIDLFVSTLSEIGKFWDIARRYTEILSRVSEEYRHSQSLKITQGKCVTPSSVKILADMRRAAFDLELLISRQPRTSVKSNQPTRPDSPTPNEMEYLDVFGFFNFPRVPWMSNNPSGNESDPNCRPMPAHVEIFEAMDVPDFAVPDPEADWLFQTS